MKIVDFFKKYYVIVAFMGGTLLILNQTGFNMNLYGYYKDLDVEGKILFTFMTNIVLLILGIIFTLSRIKSTQNK
ncbi:hypothetical protein KAR52_02200 [Candidatus Pacearchaeota archaeon]|nr:hypothetical protein [Candidatus Pacearchaeota archaeon]